MVVVVVVVVSPSRGPVNVGHGWPGSALVLVVVVQGGLSALTCEEGGAAGEVGVGALGLVGWGEAVEGCCWAAAPDSPPIIPFSPPGRAGWEGAVAAGAGVAGALVMSGSVMATGAALWLLLPLPLLLLPLEAAAGAEGVAVAVAVELLCALLPCSAWRLLDFSRPRSVGKAAPHSSLSSMSSLFLS